MWAFSQLIYGVIPRAQAGYTFLWLNIEFVPLSFNEKLSENTFQGGTLGLLPSVWLIIIQKAKYLISWNERNAMEGKTAAHNQFYIPLILNSSSTYFTLLLLLSNSCHLQEICR